VNLAACLISHLIARVSDHVSDARLVIARLVNTCMIACLKTCLIARLVNAHLVVRLLARIT
jgi:hypothetical protein